MAVSKGVMITVVLGVGFVLMLGAAGVGYVGWRYYSARMAAKALATATEGSEMPAGTVSEAPAPVATTDSGAGEQPNPETAPPAVTAPGTSEVATAPPAPPPTSAATRAPKPKTSSGGGKAPKAAADSDRRTPPKPQALDVGHVHGGLRKKTSPGVIYLLATGFKYDSQDADDDVHIEYRFDQIKKVEIDDGTTVEVATVDKKWKFRGEGLVISKIAAHLNAHSSEFAGK
jgi:hypothetical protein